MEHGLRIELQCVFLLDDYGMKMFMGLYGLIYQPICGNAPKQSDNVFVMLIGN